MAEQINDALEIVGVDGIDAAKVSKVGYVGRVMLEYLVGQRRRVVAIKNVLWV